MADGRDEDGSKTRPGLESGRAGVDPAADVGAADGASEPGMR